MKTILWLLLTVCILFADKTIIGKYDTIDLIEFELYDIKAKIDTGAKTSSLHCTNISLLENNQVSFTIFDQSHKKYTPVTITRPISRIAQVKSSNGKEQKRYFIITKIKLFDKIYETEFSLNDRSSMNFPILLGRSLLQEGFLVDVTQEYLSRNKTLE
ncbi:MAG: ATP-dependent zinc protease [Campylobacterales bacterium]|nr:ATP-dependent zinc protease [Campylobacterales bacterium]